MIDRARRRLTIVYLALLAVVLLAFTAVTYTALAIVMQPTFDIGPETTDDVAAAIYREVLGRIGVGLIAADIVAIGVLGVAASVLASRSLEPVRRAHLRQR